MVDVKATSHFRKVSLVYLVERTDEGFVVEQILVDYDYAVNLMSHG